MITNFVFEFVSIRGYTTGVRFRVYTAKPSVYGGKPSVCGRIKCIRRLTEGMLFRVYPAKPSVYGGKPSVYGRTECIRRSTEGIRQPYYKISHNFIIIIIYLKLFRCECIRRNRVYMAGNRVYTAEPSVYGGQPSVYGGHIHSFSIRVYTAR